jgi:zinc transport system substrate-binding protein
MRGRGKRVEGRGAEAQETLSSTLSLTCKMEPDKVQDKVKDKVMGRRWWGQRLLALLLLLLAAAPATFAGAKGEFRIVCSFYPMYVMALNIAGETPGVSVECMTPATVGCLHDYQLTPGDLKRLGAADVFVANGAGMESFMEKAVRQAPRLKVIEASKGLKLVANDNPHVWVSISGAIGETKNIAQGLAAADPAHAAAYEANGAKYVAKLEQLRQQMHAALDGLKHREIITFHEAFPYFASEFNLQVVGVVEREPGSEPGAGELARTIALVRNKHVQALFAEPQYPEKSAEVIHRETGVPVRILDPAVTGPMEPQQARDSYLEAMRKNLAVLVAALKD